MCFNGYKLFRFSLGIAGSVAGFCLGRFLIKVTGDMGIEWSEIARIIVLAVLRSRIQALHESPDRNNHDNLCPLVLR